MKAGDVVWVLRRSGEWEKCGVFFAYGEEPTLVRVKRPCGTEDHYRLDTLEAMQTLRAATEAVAKARDAVVEAARVWDTYEPRDGRDDGHIDDLRSALTTLRSAERAEAEARAKLEALR